MASDEAVDAAHNYVAFKTSLSAWAKGKDVVEKIGEGMFRFTAVDGPNHRRVNAFHKGIRSQKNLRAAVRHERAEVGKRFLGEQISKIRWDRLRHWNLPVVGNRTCG